MAALLLLLLLIGLAVAAYRGHTPDTRDADYGLGRVVEPRETAPRVAATGNLPGKVGPRSSVDRAAAF
jgi:hypothetical protein